MQEIWKDIIGYEGIYQISTYGNVRSVDRYCSSGQFRKGKVLKVDFSPYAHVALSKNNKTKNYNIHRLVAEAFIPNPDNLPCVNHRDEDKTNNHVENLEWCTYSYNNDYSSITKKAADSRRGKSLSVEHKQRISQTLKNNAQERMSKRAQTMRERYPNGIEFTDEYKNKISKALKGKPKSESTKQKMRKPKSAEHIEHMREAQRLSHKARKLGMTYKEYLTHMSSNIQ